MILKEYGVSQLALDQEFRDVVSVTKSSIDHRPAWIGSYWPNGPTPTSSLLQWVRIHYVYYLSFIRDFVFSTGTSLDIGCGSGHTTAMVSRYLGKTIGVDCDPVAIEFARKYNAREQASFLIGEFPCDVRGKFSYIFCVETIEHIEPGDTQVAFINAALSILKKDGMLFVTTPIGGTEERSPPHIGLLYDSDIEMLKEMYPSLSVDTLSNKRVETPLDDPVSDNGSHYRMVFRKC